MVCSFQPNCCPLLVFKLNRKQTGWIGVWNNLIFFGRLIWRLWLFHVIHATGCVRGCVDGNNTYRCWFSTPSRGSCHFFFHLNFFSSDFSNTDGGEEEERKKDASLFRILLLLQASSHFHPFPPSPTPDSSLYRCSHKSHNAPVIITPTPVYLQPVAWRGASLSLSLFLSTSLSPPPLLLCFPVPFLFFLSVMSFLFFSFLSSACLNLAPVPHFCILCCLFL